MKDPNLESLLGRRIIGAIVKEPSRPNAEPSGQLFLILDDGTYAEVFAPRGGLYFSMAWPGGAEEARGYMAASHKIIREAHLS